MKSGLHTLHCLVYQCLDPRNRARSTFASRRCIVSVKGEASRKAERFQADDALETNLSSSPALRGHNPTQGTPSLLGIPPELRQMIYDHLTWDLSIRIIQTTGLDPYTIHRQGFQTELRQTSKMILDETSARVEDAAIQLRIDRPFWPNGDGKKHLAAIPAQVLKQIEVLYAPTLLPARFIRLFEGIKEISLNHVICDINPHCSSVRIDGETSPKIIESSNAQQVEKHSWRLIFGYFTNSLIFRRSWNMMDYAVPCHIQYTYSIYYVDKMRTVGLGWYLKFDSKLTQPLTIRKARFTERTAFKDSMLGIGYCSNRSTPGSEATEIDWIVELLDQYMQ